MLSSRTVMTLRERIAWHESSHATAALCYSVPIIRICIDAAVPHMRRGLHRLP
jgi:hypothetical protein